MQKLQRNFGVGVETWAEWGGGTGVIRCSSSRAPPLSMLISQNSVSQNNWAVSLERLEWVLVIIADIF